MEPFYFSCNFIGGLSHLNSNNIIKCKFNFQVLSNPDRATLEKLKSCRLPTPVLGMSFFDDGPKCF